MKQYDVVEIVDKINMLSGRYPIGIKWIFKDMLFPPTFVLPNHFISKYI